MIQLKSLNKDLISSKINTFNNQDIEITLIPFDLTILLLKNLQIVFLLMKLIV